MMKHSIVALFSVLTCIVNGQFLGNWNHDLHGFRPYVAHSPSSLSNSANSPIGAQQYDTDQQPEMRNLLVLTKLALLDKNYRKLAEELRTNLSDADDKIMDLTNKLANMTQVLEQTESEMADTKASLASVESNLQNMTQALEQTESELADTKASLASVESNLQNYSTNATAEIELLKVKIDALNCNCSSGAGAGAAPVSLGKIPGSCADLQTVGNANSGLFSVMGSKQVETVYCDFTKNVTDSGFQKLIGYQDVKSKPIYFYVQKSADFGTESVPIPFETEIINSGGAMNITSGIFTAPVNGTYFFSFTAHVMFNAEADSPSLVLSICKNGVKVGVTAIFDATVIPPMSAPMSPITLQSTLEMQPSDKVWVQLELANDAGLYFSDSYTHFNGLLLQEDIATSL